MKTAGKAYFVLLVCQCGRDDGVLVMPESGCFVGWAAYYEHDPVFTEI